MSHEHSGSAAVVEFRSHLLILVVGDDPYISKGMEVMYERWLVVFLYLYCEAPLVGLELGGYDKVLGLYVWYCVVSYLCFSFLNSSPAVISSTLSACMVHVVA